MAADATMLTGVETLDEKIKRRGVNNIRLLIQREKIEGAQASSTGEATSQFDQVGLDRIYIFHFAEDEDLLTVIEDFSSDPNVLYAEPDYAIRGFQIPNDSRFNSQWALTKISAPQAWDLAAQDSTITVAVIDSGINYLHEDLAGNVGQGHNYVSGNGDAMDDHGHGSHVAGVIGASANNGKGIAGLNWNVRLMPVKVLDANQNGWTAHLVQGIRYAADNGARIINLSLGGPGNMTLKSAVDYALAKGCLVVAAMGNQDNSTPLYPAAFEEVLAVGGTYESDLRVSEATGGSNFGAHIDVVAPGYAIWSTVLGNGYQQFSGTSMATPHVTGLAALILSARPDLTAGQVQDIIKQSADDLVGAPNEDTEGWDQYFGWGRINAHAAMTLALQAPEPPGPPGNNPPSITSNPVTFASEDAAYKYNITLNDPDPQETLTLSGTYPGWLTLTQQSGTSATLGGTPGNFDVGSHQVNLTVTDAAGLTGSQSFTITVANVNDAPVFTSKSVNAATEDQPYRYAISAADVDDGDTLTISGTYPNWLKLTDNGNGTATLSGTPTNGDVGSHAVQLTVRDRSQTGVSQPFTINVSNVNDAPVIISTPFTTATEGQPYIYTLGAADEDVGDSLTFSGTYPGWLSLTDNGNGTATLSGTAGSGDSGEHPIELVAADGAGLRAVQTYTLSVVSAPVAGGLECPAGCLSRNDGGNPSGNLDPVTGQPRIDLQYTFSVVMNDSSGAPPAQVRLVLNGYAYPLNLLSGSPETGATYGLTLQLGFIATNLYHFEARDNTGNLIYRLPETGEMTGPTMELLNGINMVGVPGDLASASLGAVEALGTSDAWRWIPAGLTSNVNQGGFVPVDATGPVNIGEGFFITRDPNVSTMPALENLPEYSADTLNINLGPGWNLISNPYRGGVRLSDTLVARGSDAPVGWKQAAANLWLINAIYYFKGSDWGSVYGLDSAGGNPEGILVPGIGYWVYLSRNDASYRLIIPKP